jgi:hypothetical protein
MTLRLVRPLATVVEGAAVVAVLGGCGGAEPFVPVPSGLQLSATSVTLDAIGDTAILTASVLDQNGDPIPGEQVTWSTEDPATVSINSVSGLMTAVAVGSAIITAVADTFSATALATVSPVPAALAKIAGDEQSAGFGGTLPNNVTVQVKDRLGFSIQGASVVFAVTQGGGSVGALSVRTDSIGFASNSWTLGSSVGTHSLSASVSGPVPAVTFTATAINLGITSVTPDTLVEGQSATIAGVGFDPVAANNTVRIGGMTAAVTQASATSLDVTVPAGACAPAGTVGVTVTVAGAPSAPFNHQQRPAAFTSLAVGEQQVLRSPADLCVQLAPSSVAEAYLIGVQSTSEAASSLTPLTVSASAATAAVAAPLPPPVRARSSVALSAAQRARFARWERHREAEWNLRQRERALSSLIRRNAQLLRQAGANQVSQIPPVVNVGDSLDIKFPSVASSDFCANFVSIRVVVRAVGTRGVWLEDVGNPAGFSATNFQALSALLDNPIYDTDVAYFGAPSDLDGNSRIAIVVTKEVNKVGFLGFVVSTDFGSCPSSNAGEFFYGIAPDPANTIGGGAYALADALADYPVLIAHEFSHIIQFSARIALGASFMSAWTAEGQAVLAEEVVGHAVEGRMPGQNLSFAVAYNQDDPSSYDWYSFWVNTTARYYGYNDNDPSTRVSGAPEQCSFVTTTGPCTGGFVIYGPPFTLLRWISDHLGPTFPGGEQGLHQALVNNTGTGYANITNVVGASMDSLLPQWAAMLYVDDRVPGAVTRLTMPSWNMLSIENGIRAINSNAVLAPRERSFGAFSDDISVRSGSSAYFRLSGASRPGTSVKVRSSGTAPPSNIQLWVVRTQ